MSSSGLLCKSSVSCCRSVYLKRYNLLKPVQTCRKLSRCVLTCSNVYELIWALSKISIFCYQSKYINAFQLYKRESMHIDNLNCVSLVQMNFILSMRVKTCQDMHYTSLLDAIATAIIC